MMASGSNHRVQRGVDISFRRHGSASEESQAVDGTTTISCDRQVKAR